MSALDQQILQDKGGCFACGADNQHGLRLRIEFGEGQASCRLTLAPHFQGWHDIAHGGVVCAILDEVMGYAVTGTLGQGLTTGLEAKFRKPVPLGQELEARGWVTKREGRRAQAVGEIRLLADGTVLAEGSAKWLLKLDDKGEPIPWTPGSSWS